MTDLTGKTAFVTGSSRGIGAAIARRLAGAGARVALHGRDEAALATLSRGIPSSIFVTGDLRDRAATAQMAEKVLAAFGTLDILVANAGASHAPPQMIEEITDEVWDANIDGNLGATFRTVRALLPSMKAAGRGSIVTIASAAGRKPSGYSPVAYGTAKAAIVHLTRCLAAQAGPMGIRANCVAPETILTENNLQRIPAETQREMIAAHPIRRLGTPEDVAAAVLFLVSDAAGWISGTVTDVAGGSVLA
jgi:3-oxoacyl-[acyl-carrier protein] reductase